MHRIIVAIRTIYGVPGPRGKGKKGLISQSGVDCLDKVLGRVVSVKEAGTALAAVVDPAGVGDDLKLDKISSLSSSDVSPHEHEDVVRQIVQCQKAEAWPRAHMSCEATSQCRVCTENIIIDTILSCSLLLLCVGVCVCVSEV